MPRRRTIVAALALSLAVFASACSHLRGSKPYRYNVSFDGDGRPWQEASHAESRAVMTREYVRAGETLASWQELLTVQVFDKASGKFPAPDEAETALHAKMKERCPAVAWNEIASDSAGVLYEWRIAGCPAQPDQHEVARIVESTGARARIAYTRKGGAMPDSVRAGWVARLRGARFTTTPTR
jgi:hypothetical protein